MSTEIERLQRLLANAEQQLSASQQRLSKTNLPTFLDGLHRYLFLGLEVQPDETQSTRGDPTNTTNMLRPRKLKAWDTFEREQEEVWQLLMESSIVEDKLFTSLHTLEEMGESIRQRLIGSELDLNHFLRQTVEDHVSKIIEELYRDPVLRRKFDLRGSIRFENHSNTLSPEQELEEGLQSIDIRGRSTRRRSPRIAAKEQSRSHTNTGEPKTPKPKTTKRPRADQFCIYNIPNESSESAHRVAAYVKEYKSPHKVKLGLIYGGLDNIDVDELMTQNDNEPSTVRLQRAVLGLLSQPFSYMVHARTQVGVFSTGEVDIYLRIGEDPSTLFYYLSVPKGDVGDETGWDPYSNHPNRLHLTAVGRSLAFTLQALKLQQRSQAWGLHAASSLPKWEIVLGDALDDIADEEIPSSEYRPSRTESFVRSPIQLRRRRHESTSENCRPPERWGDSEDEEGDPHTPSRTQPLPRDSKRAKPESHRLKSSTTSQSSQENKRRYCTLRCLRGMVKGRGEDLDQACPNVHDHGRTCHTIDSKTFLNELKRQLSQTINADCETLGIHGSRGALLKVTLSSLGYTVPAKCTEFRDHLTHEAAIYNKLRSIQGQYVPIYFGSIDLDHPYSYDGIAYLRHMMLLTPGGQSLDHSLSEMDRDLLVSKIKESISAIHSLGVIHNDPAPRNWKYNKETDSVVFFDFERAETIKQRPILGIISPNRKRKRNDVDTKQKRLKKGFVEETNRAVYELKCLPVCRSRY
ncbi:hypothetical protein N7478_000686 [Penicillium angulare]|uniref:uncharacterized protein n=1 Tax=Penicillium angulare TaxID=116970 RepID=UPI002541A89D|nr:uncharacterized protein N7478_000686 [Penicillium angulare]KAJ5291435.1 hypothetical protein N7478_000686 [Penicillium angulare]